MKCQGFYKGGTTADLVDQINLWLKGEPHISIDKTITFEKSLLIFYSDRRDKLMEIERINSEDENG